MRQLDALSSPRFSQISTFARLPFTKDLAGVRAAFIGIPFDDATTYRPGARFGPMGIRQGSRLLRPYNQFVDAYPFDELNACDAGDIDTLPGYIQDTFSVVERGIFEVASRTVPFIAGGDHSITLPVLRALKRIHGKVNIVHLDSHYDFWDTYWGKKYTHGSWLRRALEEGLIKDVVQLGMRGSTFSKDDLVTQKTLGITGFSVVDLKNSPEVVLEKVNSLYGKTYISIDIDVVDPAYAPGTGTPEVGGISSYEFIRFLRSLSVDIAGLDVVEVSPPYDLSELTSMLAANAIYEVMSTLAKGGQGS
jgi:agmatinase